MGGLPLHWHWVAGLPWLWRTGRLAARQRLTDSLISPPALHALKTHGGRSSIEYLPYKIVRRNIPPRAGSPPALTKNRGVL